MRIGIYNRYWSTRGGGERYAGALAETLSRHHRVEVIGTEPVALDDLAEHLGLDLSRTRFRLWPSATGSELAEATAEYDLFINSTFGSNLVSNAPRSVNLVFFPQPILPLGVIRRLQSALSRLGAWAQPRIAPVAGFHRAEASGRRWSGERAVLSISPRQLRHGELRLTFDRLGPWPLAEALRDVSAPGVDWRVDGDDLVLSRRHPGREPFEVELVCRTFVPADQGLSVDRRQLGLCLAPMQSSPRLLPRLVEHFTRRLEPYRPDFLDSYDLHLAISDYTRQWIERRWRRPSEVLAPPLELGLFSTPDLAVKRKRILSVGRFFHGSHNKKHAEMLRVFRRMCNRGQIPDGWSFHLVGNLHRNRLADLENFAELERLADGYPVRLLADLPLEDLRREYREASIFWHAAGWGESERRQPEKHEHFGLTTCEAMASAAIPVVIAKAGQLEIVRDGDNGFLFSSGRRLAAITRRLIEGHGEPWVGALMERARASVERFGRPAFDERLLSILTDRGLLE